MDAIKSVVDVAGALKKVLDDMKGIPNDAASLILRVEGISARLKNLDVTAQEELAGKENETMLAGLSAALQDAKEFCEGIAKKHSSSGKSYTGRVLQKVSLAFGAWTGEDKENLLIKFNKINQEINDVQLHLAIINNGDSKELKFNISAMIAEQNAVAISLTRMENASEHSFDDVMSELYTMRTFRNLARRETTFQTTSGPDYSFDDKLLVLADGRQLYWWAPIERECMRGNVSVMHQQQQQLVQLKQQKDQVDRVNACALGPWSYDHTSGLVTCAGGGKMKDRWQLYSCKSVMPAKDQELSTLPEDRPGSHAYVACEGEHGNDDPENRQWNYNPETGILKLRKSGAELFMPTDDLADPTEAVSEVERPLKRPKFSRKMFYGIGPVDAESAPDPVDGHFFLRTA